MARDTLQGLLEAFTEEGKEPKGGDITLSADPMDVGLAVEGDGVGLSSTDQASSPGVTDNREDQFNRESGRFHDPSSGEFEPGSPPPDLDKSTDRYRGKNGQFKSSPDDLYDEPAEVKRDSLEPQG